MNTYYGSYYITILRKQTMITQERQIWCGITHMWTPKKKKKARLVEIAEK